MDFMARCHGGHDHGQAAADGRVMETHRTAFAVGATQTQGWPPACARSRVSDRHSLRAQDRHAMGISAPRDGVRQRDDLLASAARLAEGWGLGRAASGSSGPASICRPTRLVTSCRGQRFGPCGGGGEKTGPNPTDRRKRGSKQHIITDANGVPFSAILTGANDNDVTQLIPLVESVPPVRGKVGHPRRRPAELAADRAYDSYWHKVWLRYRGIEPLIASRGAKHGSGLGSVRWVVERSLSWLHQYRRLQTRYERRADIHEGFMTLGCALICWKKLNHGIC